MRVVSSTNISQMLHAIVWSVCSVQYVIQNMDTTMLFDILLTLFQICVVWFGFYCWRIPSVWQWFAAVPAGEQLQKKTKASNSLSITHICFQFLHPLNVFVSTHL